MKHTIKKTQITNIMNNWWLLIWFSRSMVIGNTMNNNMLTNLTGEIGLIIVRYWSEHTGSIGMSKQ